MKKARRMLDEFLENNKNLFEQHDLEIDADEIHDGLPQNAYAFVDVFEKRDENKDGWKVNPFPKPVGLRLRLQIMGGDAFSFRSLSRWRLLGGFPRKWLI